MKIVPVGVQQPQAPQNNSKADARARAISMLTGNQQAAPAQQTTPVANPNRITAEEMSAIQPAATTEPQIPVPDIQTEKPSVDAAEAERVQRKFMELVRQDKAQRAKELALKQREDELAAREAKLQNQPAFDESKYIPRERLKQDALAVLAEEGLSYEEITAQILNQPNRDPRVDAELNALKNEIKRLQEANEQSKKADEQKQTEAYQAAVKQIEMDVKSLIKNDSSYEAIRASNATKDVVDLITETYNQDGILLTVEEAAQQVEDYLVEQYTKFTSISKIKQKLEQSQATKAQATSVTTSEQTAPQPPKMKTLTNSVGSTKPLSSRERAILAFEGKLK